MQQDTGNITRCRCGRLYRTYSYYCGDQSRCEKCREALLKELEEQEKRDKELSGDRQ